MSRRDPADQPVEMTGRTMGITWNEPSNVTEEQFEVIRSHFDGRAKDRLTERDIFAYRQICSSDGVDSYFTQPDLETSLRGYVKDLVAGQAVLGNHDVRTFPYGSSYGGVVEAADPTRAEYESTFYRRYADRPDMATRNWTIGDYYIARGLTVNGQSTDDLIRGIELGALKRSSISFIVGSYVCNADGERYEDFGFWGLEPGEGCLHYPGIEYSDGKGGSSVAWARMLGNQLLETSWVYRNASPSSMLLRRAEALAQMGVLDARQVTQLEERYQMRLPAFDRSVFQSKEVPRMPPENQTAPSAVDDPPATEDTSITAVIAEASDDGQHRATLSLLQTRADALRTANDGEEVTPETIRSLRKQAAVGERLMGERIDETVRAKVRALGPDRVDTVRYRATLVALGDADFVSEELSTWNSAAATVFTPGRQVVPEDPPAEKKAAKPRAVTTDAGLLSGLTSGRPVASKEG